MLAAEGMKGGGGGRIIISAYATVRGCSSIRVIIGT
jgi:hypothetical protein